MTYPEPNFIGKEQILLAGLLGSTLGMAAGLYVAPRAILPFSLLGGVAGGAIAASAVINQPRKQVIEGRQAISDRPQHEYLPPSPRPLLAGTVDSSSRPLQLGSVTLTPKHETGNFFIVGRSGSGKSQAFLQLLEDLRHRPDFRVVVLDRGGEIIQRLYRPKDLIFNPLDDRTVAWCHTQELRHLNPVTAAASFLPIPNNSKDAIWYEYGQLLLAAIWQNCLSNSEVKQVLRGNQAQIRQWVQGTRAAQCFDDPRLAGSVLLTLTPTTHCYEFLPDGGEPLSFFEYGRGGDPRWLFLPLLEEQTDILKAPFSAAIDLIIRGVLSQPENPATKTVIVIDELGALQKLPSLQRFLSEARKYGGCAILGTQTEAQMTELYSQEATRILLQNTRTKLIFNCPDPETSRLMAETIGKRKVWQQGLHYKMGQRYDPNRNWDQVEEYAVPPYELQMLPDLTGYLLLGDDSPVFKVQVPTSTLSCSTPRYMPRSQVAQLLDDLGSESLPLWRSL